MNNKVKNYVDALFTGVPRSKKATELKEELLSNMSERFEDYMAQGKTEIQAYSLAVSNMGDVDGMLSELIPDADFKQEANKYRTRNAKNTAIGVSLYILGAAVLIGFTMVGERMGAEDSYAMMGVVVLLCLAAVATGLIVYTHMSTPQEYKDFDEDAARDRRLYASKDGSLLKSIMSIYWSVVTFIYLGVSFLSGEWGISWMIWVLAGVFAEIIKTIFEMRNCDDK
ncbi:MAG: permease prefix domain 1-containing protein [Oscillospiraceae bacterium]